MTKDTINVSGEVITETDAAFRFFDGIRYFWLPKSQCEWDPDEKEMTLPEWMAIEKGIV